MVLDEKGGWEGQNGAMLTLVAVTGVKGRRV
jgi:hypothetical protein